MNIANIIFHKEMLFMGSVKQSRDTVSLYYHFAMNVLSVLAAYSFYEKKQSINIDYSIEHVDGQLTVIQ